MIRDDDLHGPTRGLERCALILVLTKRVRCGTAGTIMLSQLNPYTKTPTIPAQGKAERSAYPDINSCATAPRHQLEADDKPGVY